MAFRHAVGTNKNHDMENIIGGQKKVLTEKNSQPLQNRVALATISDRNILLKPKLREQNNKGNENVTFKAGKAKSVTASFKSFSIYQDDENEAIKNEKVSIIRVDKVQDEKPNENFEDRADLDNTQSSIEGRLVPNSLVKRLPKQGANVSCISIDSVSEVDVESCKDSPMALDVSMLDERIQELRSLSKDFFVVPEYDNDIYTYLREAEQRNRPKTNYMRKQSDITEGMRSILVDWLVEVAEEYKLQTETLYLTVNYIDRFLSYMSVLRGKLQLVGASCMFIASKYEEIYPPDVGEFVYITDDTYNKKQVLKMETLVLRVLSFDLVTPTVYCFLQRYCKIDEVDEVTECLALYISELSLLDGEKYLPHLSSEIAASAVCLANHTRRRIPWSSKLVAASGYTIQHFHTCLNKLYQTYRSAPVHPQQAIREKYKNSKFHEVSLISVPPSLPI